MSCRSSNSNSDAMRHHAQIIGLKRKSTDCDVLSCASGSASASVSVHSSHCVAEKNWKLKFNSLLKFKAENGHCDVPARYDEDPKLGHWVMTQRRQYHLMQKGKDTRMTQARIALLERVGLQWSVRMNPTNLWNRRLQELRDYKEKHGNCLVPQRFSKNPQLGTWVNTQRRHYKFLTSGKKSCLTKERLEKLEELGFVWSTHNLPSKDGGAQEFIAYMHGNDTMTSGPGGSTSVAKKSSGNGANTSASVSRNAKKTQKS